MVGAHGPQFRERDSVMTAWVCVGVAVVFALWLMLGLWLVFSKADPR